MYYHFKIHKEGRGYWAECVELKGCFTEGNTKKELLENMEDALNVYLEEPSSSTHLAALPKKSVRGKNIIQVPVDPEIAFAFMIRYHRITNKMTQRQAAKKLGFSNIYSYQRLEKRCNVRLDMIGKLKNLFPKLSIDLVFA